MRYERWVVDAPSFGPSTGGAIETRHEQNGSAADEKNPGTENRPGVAYLACSGCCASSLAKAF